MKTTALLRCLIALAALSPTLASAHKLGEHPAIIAARVYAAQGYDYASKFYPHPAGLYLLSRAPADAPAEAAADDRAAAVAAASAADRPLFAQRRPDAASISNMPAR
jgi:hypothetical protein